MSRFRLEFTDDDSTLYFEADGFYEDGDVISMHIDERVVASFQRDTLAGLPKLVS